MDEKPDTKVQVTTESSEDEKTSNLNGQAPHRIGKDNEDVSTGGQNSNEKDIHDLTRNLSTSRSRSRSPPSPTPSHSAEVDTNQPSLTALHNPDLTSPTTNSSTQPTTTPNTDDEYATGPPPLPYDLREHVLSMTFFWFLIGAECCFIPLALYYSLRTTSMRPGAYFAIITAAFGFVSGYEFGIRGWRLVRRTDEYRPLYNSPRFWSFDATQLILAPPCTMLTGVLIGFSIPDPPIVKGLSIPMAIGFIMIAIMMGTSGWANYKGWRLKYFRLSSHIYGDVCPPLTYCFLEDVVAVDGKGGKKYRAAAMERYNSSPRFRKMLIQILWAWTITSFIVGVVLLIVIWMIPDQIAYGLGWGVPTVYCILGALLTTVWAKRCLRIEKKMWVSDRSTPP